MRKRGKRGVSEALSTTSLLLISIFIVIILYIFIISITKEKTSETERKLEAIRNIDLKIEKVIIEQGNLKIYVQNKGQQDISSFIVRVTNSTDTTYFNDSVYLENKEKLGPLNTRSLIIIPAPFGTKIENYKLIEVYPKFEYLEDNKIKEGTAETAKSSFSGKEIIYVSEKSICGDFLCETEKGENELNCEEDCGSYNLFISVSGNNNNNGNFTNPFLTLDRARDEIREMKQEGKFNKPINVLLRGGTYYLLNTFELNEQDSGTSDFPITYQSYPGEIAKISGGKKIEGWTSIGGGTYKTNVGQLKFRQFYVNGQEASRARTNYKNMTLFEYKRNPDGTIKKVAGTNYDELTGRIIVKKEDVSNWANLNTANLPEMHAQQKWFQHIFRIKSISYDVNPLDADPSKNVILNLAEPEATIIQSYYHRANGWAPTLYFFENAFELLNEKGEWFLDNSGDLYYMPRDNESIKSSEFVVPVLVEKLLILEGENNDETINFVNFKNLVFEYSNWIMPSEFGFMGEQAGFYVLEWYWRNPKQPPAAISLRKAKNILFDGCEFKNLGGNGVSFEKGVHNSIVNNSEFDNIASTAFLIDGDLTMSWYAGAPPTDRRDICSNNMITNSRILNFGKNYFGAVGIFAPFVENTTITNNEIAYGPYDGIHFGWGWTANHKLTKNATISRNHIHHTMQELSDGGQIYILGNLINITVSENYIHDTGCSLYSYLNNAHAGIYLDGVGLRDETSGGWIIPPDVLVKDNIVIRAANCPGWSDPFWLWYAKSGSSGNYETTSGHEDIVNNAGPQ